ncbi:MAG: TetR/AcrR family transcriptional regulator [Pseudomonadota bacterium]|nr:TetR/AcrR family transcriptional regulator [Pseudomonadota bacterium]MEC9236911.1 TetR/AcrR family transcriptional regulator [Pseudomonadota bacterium]
MSSAANARASALADVIRDEQPKKTAKAKDEKPARKVGRPRSEKSRKAIVNAVNRMLLHKQASDLSIEAIAKKAGVGKTTIYRWWPDKIALILEAINANGANVPQPVHKSAGERLLWQLERFLRLLRGRNGKVIIEMMAQAQASPDALGSYYESFMLVHEENLAEIIETGKNAGAFRKDLDTAMAVDMIYGGIVYHLMSGSDELDEDFIARYPNEALRLVR